LMGDNDDFSSFGRDMVVDLFGGVFHISLNRALYGIDVFLSICGVCTSFLWINY
jgi:hypothetical protein